MLLAQELIRQNEKEKDCSQDEKIVEETEYSFNLTIGIPLIFF